MFFVSLFIQNRAYGGPEEGGWWYDCGVPAELDDYPSDSRPLAFRSEETARNTCRYYNERFEKPLNEGFNSDLNSVNCEGHYRFLVTKGWPKPFPSESPHYE